MAPLELRATTVGEPPWQLDGELCLPDGHASPGAALIHGSGPNDRDHRTGRIQLFRELARGLAERGVAALRYDKRTFVYRDRLARRLADEMTLHEEAVLDGAAAVDAMRRQRGVDPRRIFVFGYSLGGLAAPRVAALDGSVRGLVIAAATLRPLEDCLVDQLHHLAQREGAEGRPARQALARAQDDLERIQQLLGGAPALLHERLLGHSAEYWLDLARHRPSDLLDELDLPLLVLHPGRDYQVSDRDLASWQQAVPRWPHAELRVYPTLDHALVTSGRSGSPNDSDAAGELSERLLDDVARWIHRDGQQGPG
ncbi:MAG: alpha/beta fold hydrolase [Deltaproteobacteria bacterium]|jgi:dienelactone hydrolase|nr:alpha/beta fold hydrolase [Deltaproteobacteria bacterium]MBW2533383.1 alpha/beta fold hydrolase [Deltaproteobacteria bacterium]